MNNSDFFTLSYDDKSIKVLQIKNGGKVYLGESELRSGIVSNGKILRKENFAEVLKVLLSKTKPGKITSDLVVTALPESKVFIKILEIPKISPDKIEQAIAWQAESILPVAPEYVYLDWQKIAETPQGQIKLLITACPKDIIDSLIDSLRLLNLTTIGIKSKAGALAGLFSRTLHKSVMIINIEANESSFIIAKNNVARVSTNLATNDNVSLLNKIKETKDFYEKRKGERKIEEIIISGQKDIKELEKKIKSEFGLSVKSGRYPDKNTKIDINNEYLYLINLGLAYNPLVGVNLLPDTLKQNYITGETNKKMFVTERLVLLITAILLLIMGLTWWILSIDLNKTNRVLASAKLTQISPKAQDIENRIIDLNKRLTRIESLKGQKSQYSKVLEEVSNVSQEGISILEFFLDKEVSKFKLTGIAKTRTQLLEYKNQLQKNDFFKNVTISLKSLERPENINFELYFDIK